VCGALSRDICSKAMAEETAFPVIARVNWQ